MRSKVRQLFIIAGMLLFILSTLGVTTPSAIEDNTWELTITAAGQDPNSFQVMNEQVIDESDVIIGLVNEGSYSIDPPAWPIEKYTVCLKVLGDGGNLYMVDMRQIGSDREEWILRLEIGPDADPNFPDYYPVLSWEWEPYGIVAGTLKLWRGDTEDGDLLVSDMSEANRYQSQEDDVSDEAPIGKILKYTLVFLPVNPPEISSVPPSSAKAGDEYFYEPILAADPADSWSLEGPPIDMSIDPNTGRITWIPHENQIGDHEVTLTAVNKGGSDSQTWTISVDPNIISVPPASARAGEEYTYSPIVSGQGTITWSLIQEPEGMVIDEGSGYLTWIPHEGQVQPHTITLKVVVNGKEDSQTWTISVDPNIISVPPASAKVGEEYTYSPIVLGQGTITWSLIQKPEGMDIEAGCITWIPDEEQIQTHVVILKVTVNGKEDSQTWMITVEAGSSEPLDGSSGGGGGCFLSLF